MMVLNSIELVKGLILTNDLKLVHKFSCSYLYSYLIAKQRGAIILHQLNRQFKPSRLQSSGDFMHLCNYVSTATIFKLNYLIPVKVSVLFQLKPVNECR